MRTIIVILVRLILMKALFNSLIMTAKRHLYVVLKSLSLYFYLTLPAAELFLYHVFSHVMQMPV